MDAEILFPGISLFGSNKVYSSDDKSRAPLARKIFKSRRRKIHLMEMKNFMSGMVVASSFHNKSEHPDSDGDNNGVAAHSSTFAGGGDERFPALSDATLLPIIGDRRIPALADSVASDHCLGPAPPVVNLVDTQVVLVVVQPQISLTQYNLRPRVSRLP